MRPLLVRLITLLILLLSGTSCVKDVIMDANEKPQLAVVCILSDDPVQELRLSFTKGASLEEPHPVIEADAYLKDLTTWDEPMMFERQEDGVWRLDYAAVPGHKYRLEVTVPGYDPLWAEDTMPDKIHVYLQRQYWLSDKLESPTGYMWLPPLYGGPELYETNLWCDGENLPRGETYFGVVALNDPVWIYAMNYNTATGKREIVEDICTECQYADEFNLKGSTYIPPQWDEPIPYQVKDQYADLLKDTHTKALYPWLEGSPMHRRYIRLAPMNLRNEEGKLVPLAFGISGSMRGKYNNEDNYLDYFYHGRWGFVRNLAEDEGYVVWLAVSEAFDKYLKDAYQAVEIQSSTDLTTIYLRDNMPSNIKQGNGSSGLGIFGCKLERKYQWSSEGTYIDYDRSNEPPSYRELASGDKWHFFFIPREEREYYESK